MGPASAGARGASLRSGFAWTLAGNGVYGAGQWAVLSLVAKLGGAGMLGEYAWAVALSAPPVMLSHLNLRAVLATDSARRYPLGDYLAARLAATVAGLVVVAAIAAVAAHDRRTAILVLLAGVAQSAETLSDLYYGAMQRRERMDLVARSMMARGVLSAAAPGAVLALGGGLMAALAALAGVRFLVLALYDRRRGTEGESRARTGRRAVRDILATALPLGAVLLLVSLNANLPRYAIERFRGLGELGAFAALASFMAAGSAVVNALGQAALPRLADTFRRGDAREFRALALKLSAVVLALGAAGIAGAALLGRPLLGLLFRPEYARYAGALVGLMAAAALVYAAGAFGYVVTGARAFKAQAPLFLGVAAASGAVSWLLVPRFGIAGAAWALAVSAAVQLAGEAWILARAWARRKAQ